MCCVEGVEKRAKRVEEREKHAREAEGHGGRAVRAGQSGMIFFSSWHFSVGILPCAGAAKGTKSSLPLPLPVVTYLGTCNGLGHGWLALPQRSCLIR